MTLKTKCVCGNEFYLTISTEDQASLMFAQQRFHEWLGMHSGCFNTGVQVDTSIVMEREPELLSRRDVTL